MLTSEGNRVRVTPNKVKELNGGAGEIRTPDLRFRNSEGCFDWSRKLLIIYAVSTSYADGVLIGSDPFASF